MHTDQDHLYGPVWHKSLLALHHAVNCKARVIVDQFYRNLVHLPGAGLLLEALSEVELDHLKAMQIQHLLTLASPTLDAHSHRDLALRTGRIHAIVGLSEEDLLHGHHLLHAAVRDRLNVARNERALSTMARRLIKDQAWQQEAFRQLRIMRNDVLLGVTHLVWNAISYSDLIGKIVEHLGTHVEIAGCSLGRPNNEGIFEFEAVSGEATRAYLATFGPLRKPTIMAGNSDLALGPTGRAWKSGRIEYCPSFTNDDRMLPWKEAAAKVGFRSSVAIPLSKPSGPTGAILTLYSSYPGGFGSTDQKGFVAQLQALMVFAVTRFMQKEGATDTVAYEVRKRWGDLVRSEALEMHYQPIQRIDSGEIVKVEALARIRDGGRLIAPGTFLPALSSNDLFELFVLGLKQALNQLAKWRGEGLEMRVSVNLPTSALVEERYIEAIQRVLLDNDTNPDLVTLELLETSEIPTDVDVIGAMMRFKKLGIGLAEDDLGSGHSSLSRLRQMPFDTIKIDRSIVAQIEEDASKVLHFIKQLTNLGHSLGLFVIVEGVEKPDLLEAIAVLGVDAVQGYVIARPMPAAEIADWIKGRPPMERVDTMRPKSRLAKLARILMWEKFVLRLIREVPRESRLSAIELSSRSVDMIEKAARTLLIQALLRHGPDSEEYLRARQHLIATLPAT